MPRKRPFHTIIPGFAEKDGQRVGFGMYAGTGQAVMHDTATGVNFAASDPRGDGVAIPESPRTKR